MRTLLIQGGLIFPVEHSDFIPSEIWPDPKYVDVWERRGGSERVISSRNQWLDFCMLSDELAQQS